MDTQYESKMKELEAVTSRSPLQEAAFNALTALDERNEELTEAQAGNPVPTPDPVVVAQTNVDNAKAVADAALAALDAGGTTPPSTPPTP